MAQSQWYCAECKTHGGGPPNEQSMEEHVNVEHEGGFARIIKGDRKDWENKKHQLEKIYNIGVN